MANRKYDPKGKKCQEAIRLKYENEGYAVIAKKIGVPLATVAGWFEEGGLLYGSYKECRDRWNKAKEEEGLAKLRKEFETACTMLIALMGSTNDPTKLKAVLAIIERIVGKPTQPIRHEGEANLTDLSYEQQLREIRKEYGDNPDSTSKK